jgi:hypothetical protein
MLSEDILFLSVTELAKRIRARQLSPVELTESYLDRSRGIGPKLNAYATLTPDLALQQARAAEKEIAAGKYRGSLHGIPYAAKDLLAVKGYPTGWGARPYSDQRIDNDATVIKKLEAAGAVLLGKAAMIELAGGMGYPLCLSVCHGRGQKSLEHRLLDLRIVQRFCRDYRRRTGGIRHRHGNLGLHHLSFRIFRSQRFAADVWSREPQRRHGPFLHHGQNWPHHAQR